MDHSSSVSNANLGFLQPWTGQWMDAHCHLADPRFDSCLDQVLARSKQVGVDGWIQGGVSPEDWERQLAIRERFGPGIILSFGLHPIWVAQQSSQEIELALIQLKEKISLAHAIGELGLDFHPRRSLKSSQQEQILVFEKQLKLAHEVPKPLILHVVQAHSQALRFLRKWGPFPRGGMVHLFSGSLEIAQEYLRLGFLISLGGTMTRDGFQKLKRTLHSVPLDRIVVETDSPDQLPHLPGIEGGSLNEPAHLVRIADYLGTLRQVNRDELLTQSTNNLKKLFGF
jgi:TatD DNase family protein